MKTNAPKGTIRTMPVDAANEMLREGYANAADAEEWCKLWNDPASKHLLRASVKECSFYNGRTEFRFPQISLS